jgi:guanylate kinase
LSGYLVYDLQAGVESTSPIVSQLSPPLLLVLSGPSGVGKDAVLARLAEKGLVFRRVPTVTTRPRRANERDGIDYRFLSDEEFDRLLDTGGLLEHAEVYGLRYGVPKAPVQDALTCGEDVVVRVDVQGAATLKRLLPEAVLVFLAPASPEELEQRLRRRRTEDEAVLRRRLATARREMEDQGMFHYVVVNADGRLEEAADRLAAIIEAEKRRPGRGTPVMP